LFGEVKVTLIGEGEQNLCFLVGRWEFMEGAGAGEVGMELMSRRTKAAFVKGVEGVRK